MSLISQRAKKFESSGIRKVFDLAATLKNPVNFSIGQPDFGVSEEVKTATIKAIREDKSRYTPTQGILALREKVAQKLQKENKIIKTADDILITPGTSAGIFLSLACLIDPGDEVIIPDPFFVEYPQLVEFLGGQPIFLDTYPDFQISIDKLSKLITKKTKVLILNSPNNPTGTVYSQSLLEEIVKIASRANLVIISDEIYEEFIYDGKLHFSPGSVYPQTITVGGLSKSGGMPGWRLGWVTGPGELVDKMRDMQQYTFVCAPSLVQYGALAAFDNNNHQKHQKLYQERRDLIYNLLSEKFKIIKPVGAFYIMLEVGDGDKFAQKAARNNCLLVPGGVFSQRQTHVRLSYAVNEAEIKRGVEILLKLTK